jgi:hypothetical protein
MDLPPDWANPALLEAKKTLPPGQTQALSEAGRTGWRPIAFPTARNPKKNPHPDRPVADWVESE